MSKQYKWMVIEKHNNPNEVHVVPRHGRIHKLAPDCWCQPKSATHEKTLVTHNEPN